MEDKQLQKKYTKYSIIGFVLVCFILIFPLLFILHDIGLVNMSLSPSFVPVIWVGTVISGIASIFLLIKGLKYGNKFFSIAALAIIFLLLIGFIFFIIGSTRSMLSSL